MEVNVGDVLVNLKSAREYAVVGTYSSFKYYAGATLIHEEPCEPRVQYYELRNGKRFGPRRVSPAATIAKNFGKTSKVAIVAGHQIVRIEEPTR